MDMTDRYLTHILLSCTEKLRSELSRVRKQIKKSDIINEGKKKKHR